MTIDLHEYKQLYLQTSQELLDSIVIGLNDLKNDLNNSASCTEIHRSAHSLKSQSLVMGYIQIGLAGKALEQFFLSAKEKKIVINTQHISRISTLIQEMAESLKAIKEGHGEKDLTEHIAAFQESER